MTPSGTRRRRNAALLRVLVLAMPFAVWGCHEHEEPGDQGHDHGHGHGHGHGSGDEEEGPEPLAITRWTEGHELFVELDPPQPGKPVAHHAHITILDGFQPATAGTFTVRFSKAGKVASEKSVEGVARAGIFTPEVPAPAEAGTYRLTMIFEDDGARAEFDCGEVEVAAEAPASEEEAGGAELSFLKEQQWKIPFATTWSTKRKMAREIPLPAVVDVASDDQLTIASPTGGRFFFREAGAVTLGTALEAGTILGTVAPSVAGEDFSRLQLALDEASLARKHAQHEVDRVGPLVAEGLLPDKRLVEAKAELATALARLRSAQRRLGQIVAPQGKGGIPISVTAPGTVAEVLVEHGGPVHPGEPLVRLRGSGTLWARARFVARHDVVWEGASPAALRLGGQRTALGHEAGFLSPRPFVDPSSQLATWTASLGAHEGLAPGATGVLLVRIGEAVERVAVPESAVVEINTVPFVFVQTGGESFLQRRVTTGERDGGYVEIVEGVEPGERVVTRGAFDIHLAAVMGTVESHRH